MAIYEFHYIGFLLYKEILIRGITYYHIDSIGCELPVDNYERTTIHMLRYYCMTVIYQIDQLFIDIV